MLSIYHQSIVYGWTRSIEICIGGGQRSPLIDYVQSSIKVRRHGSQRSHVVLRDYHDRVTKDRSLLTTEWWRRDPSTTTAT